MLTDTLKRLVRSVVGMPILLAELMDAKTTKLDLDIAITRAQIESHNANALKAMAEKGEPPLLENTDDRMGNYL